MPNTFGTWQKHTERALEAMDKAEFPRPAVPRDPATPQGVYRNPNPGALVIARGEILSNRIAPLAAEKPAETAPAPAAGALPAKESPMPAPTPAPKRQPRHDGPPKPGERQIVFRGVGPFTLPGGGTAGLGDRVNVAAADAERMVRASGAVDFVDMPAPEPKTAAEPPEPVIGDAKLEISVSELISGRDR